MAESQAVSPQPLMTTLEALHKRIASNPEQPLIQLAEAVVLHWTRVVDGLEIVQPRLNAEGYVPTAFHFGMEANGRNRLDDCDIPPGGTPARDAFENAFTRRLEALSTELETYFQHPGYRSSSDQCDLLMIELARLSRFLGTWALVAERAHERRWRGGNRPNAPVVDLYKSEGNDTLLWQVRWNLALWEPNLNAAIVSWEGNTLAPFDEALKELRALLDLSGVDRRGRLQPPGYPLRSQGRNRLRVSILRPEQRPLRTRSVFWVRYNQLLDRIQAVASLYPSRLDDLEKDVHHFADMVQTNCYMVAAEPGFLTQGRPGVPVVRGRTTVHPLLLDATGFFKKAVLFHNGTYTIAGGGLDQMYLQLRQLERHFKFGGWSGPARPLRPVLEGCLIAWEENRWDGFTEGLLQLAERLRDDTN